MPENVIIGLDGVPYGLVKNFTNSDVMPNIKEIIDTGTFVSMKSSLPEISSVSWSSMITGKNPGEHGVFGFTDLIPNTYTLSFPNFRTLRAKPFWHQNEDKKYVIFNVPFTYPAEKLNGSLISGFVAPKLKDSVYPKDLLPELKSMDYRVDVDSAKAHKSKDLFMKNLFKVLDIRKRTYRMLWKDRNWDVFMFVITGTDRLMHFFWDSYEDENHRYHEDFLNFFREVDSIIGEINSQLTDEDNLTIISDHGFGPAGISVNINQYLLENNFLSLESERKNKRYRSIQRESKAFALDPARIYLHYKGRYPEGKVSKEDSEKILSTLTSLFEELTYKGENTIKRVFRKEEIYSGKYIKNAPDLVLLPESDYMLKGNIEKEEVFEEEIFTGKHTYEDAIFINKRKLNIEDNFSIQDVLNIIELNSKKGE